MSDNVTHSILQPTPMKTKKAKIIKIEKCTFPNGKAKIIKIEKCTFPNGDVVITTTKIMPNGVEVTTHKQA